MLRVLAIAVMVALAAPTLAVAQQQKNDRHHPWAGKRGGARPVIAPRRSPVILVPYAGTPTEYRGHMLPVAPMVDPNGIGYRPQGVHAAMPSLFLAPTYYYAYWATLGLQPPPPGFQWVRYGPDLLLVNVNTGNAVDAAYGVLDGSIDR
jgi:Ni/Co efflux regulator RcnB